MIQPSKPPVDYVAYLQDFKNFGLDKANGLSFMGWRTCKVMQGMIIDKESFRWSLRIAKYWARRRGIYGFNYGYLNGISLVIMMIKAQQYL
jgi:poly(A) polymerase Pap1